MILGVRGLTKEEYQISLAARLVVRRGAEVRRTRLMYD